MAGGMCPLLLDLNKVKLDMMSANHLLAVNQLQDILPCVQEERSRQQALLKLPFPGRVSCSKL